METTSVESLTTKKEMIEENHDLSKIKDEIYFYLKKSTENILEVGKRFISAKKIVPHGQWQQWLEDNFRLSYRTANNFMRCAERFGNLQISATLNQSQMVEMLSLPKGDEEKFIEQKTNEGNPIEKLPIKVLKNEIHAWNAKIKKNTSKNSHVDNSLSSIHETETATENNNNSPIPKNQNKIELGNLLDQFFILSDSLINVDEIGTLIENYAKNDPYQLNCKITNLSRIISKIQDCLKNVSSD